MAYFNGAYKEFPLEVVSVLNHIDTDDDVKPQLNIPATDTDNDTFIDSLLAPAEKFAENYTGRYISDTTLKLMLYNFSGETIRINATPFIDITSIKTGLAGGELTAINSANYQVEKKETYFVIHFTESQSVEEMEIIFSAGYETANLPEPIKQACIIKAADLFDIERSNYSYTITNNKTIESLLNPYVIIRA